MSSATITPALAPSTLPICTVQHDFQTILSEVREGLVPEDKFWLSCYEDGQPSVHGRVVVDLDDRDRDLARVHARDGVEMTQHIQNVVYSAACPALDIPHTRLALPAASYPDPPSTSSRRSHQITAFDVAPDGSQFATGYHDGTVFLRSVPIATSSTSPYAAAKSHVSSVTSLRFFPSSRVLLSAGADFSLHILPAEPPESIGASQVIVGPVRTLRGHTRAVTDSAIISRGRNLLSSAKDATVRLWDVPSGSQIRSIPLDSPVLKLSVGERPSISPNGTGADLSAHADVDEREVDTTDKLAFAALADGSFTVVDLRSKRPVARSAPVAAGAVATSAAALSAIAYAPGDSVLATGSTNGLVRVYDVRALGGAYACPQSGVDGHAERELGLAIAASDGLPYISCLKSTAGGAVVSVRAELVGMDCDAVRVARVVASRAGGEEIWTAGDDGVVRRHLSAR
ncbi:hypothetical protein CERSUDRAFT_155788 [Gelatoporia subvermispora B]|uniref:Uncharacterized protein n=1 Tax=Ceriporiopsis subvermispora (strain B) TaxID=914234 RepID=M2RFK0_CERS8|nr:hypothetical protein CERSUDRAFT_155788 [Gelatoporia subvermispora B]